MQCPKCGKEATGDLCAACGTYLTEETPRWYAEGIVHLAGEKQFSMAQELLQEGLQRYPTSSMLWFNAGVMAEMLKKPQDAGAYYQKAYYLKPTSEKYRQTLERVLGRPVPRLAPPPQAPAPTTPPPAPIQSPAPAPVEVAAAPAVESPALSAATPEPPSSFASLEAQLTVLSNQLSAEQTAVEEAPAPPSLAAVESATEEVAYTSGPEPLHLETPVAAEPAIPVTLDLIPAVSVPEPEAPVAEEPIFKMDDWTSEPALEADEQPVPAPLELAPVAEEPVFEATPLSLEPVEDSEATTENIYVLPAEAEDTLTAVVQPADTAAEEEPVAEATDTTWLWTLGADAPASDAPDTAISAEAPDTDPVAAQDDSWTGATLDLTDTIEETAPEITEPEAEDAPVVIEPEAETAPSEIVETTEDISAELLDLASVDEIPDTVVEEDVETPSLPAEDEVESIASLAAEQADTVMPQADEAAEALAPPVDEEIETVELSADEAAESMPVFLEVAPQIEDVVPDEPVLPLSAREETPVDQEFDAPAEPIEIAMEPEPPLEELPETAAPVEPEYLADEQDLMPIAVIADDDSEPSAFAVTSAAPEEPLPDLPHKPVAMPAPGLNAVWPGWRLVQLLSGPLAVLAGMVLVIFFFARKGTLFMIMLLVFTALVILRFVSSALSDHDHHGHRR